MSLRTLMGPAEVQSCLAQLGIAGRFTEEEVSRLHASEVRHRTGFFTFPTPTDNGGLTILGLRKAVGTVPGNAPVFFDHPWYLEEPFGYLACEPGWHSVATTVLADSVNRPIYYADSIKVGSLYLPTAAEVVLMLFLWYTASGERLMLRKHTWTRDRTQSGRFVSVGAFGKKGLFISSHDVGYHSRGLGICPVVDPLSQSSDPTGEILETNDCHDD